MSETAPLDDGPHGRYPIPLSERLLYLPVVTAFCLFVRMKVQAGDPFPAWYRWSLLIAITGLIFAIVPQWIFAATSIDPSGIRRNFSGRRRLGWDEITDFSIARSWGVRRIHVHLRGGRKLRLDGVPLRSLETLRRELGIDEKSQGGWWLVDYSQESSGGGVTIPR